MSSHLTVAWRKAAIRRELRGNGWMNTAELANALDCSPATIRRTLEQMPEVERDTRATRPQYRIDTPEGDR